MFVLKNTFFTSMLFNFSIIFKWPLKENVTFTRKNEGIFIKNVLFFGLKKWRVRFTNLRLLHPF